MKQTEIGMIPDDWEVKVFKSLTTRITVGIANSATHAYSDKGIIMFRNQNIKENFLDTNDLIYIKQDFANRYFNKQIKENDLLIARTGYPGTTCVVTKKYSGAQTFTTLIASPKSELDSNYCAYFFNSAVGKRLFSAAQIGGAQKNVNANTLSNICVPLPPTLAEQQKIAKALSDVDNVISTLEKLITKKKNLKQGTMQQLLTGKKRLPGFAKSDKFKQTEIGEIPEDWEVKSLSSIGEVKMCKRVLKFQTSETGEIPFYKIGTFGKEPDSYISRELFNFLKNNYSYPKKGDILISAAGTIGRPVVFDGKDSFFQDSNIVWLDNDESVISNYFLSYVFKIIKWQTEDGGIVSRLYNNNFRVTQIPIPSKSEQTAIANVLSSMDKEIEALNTKLEKYRNLKTGMMQQLLTGKIRLK